MALVFGSPEAKAILKTEKERKEAEKEKAEEAKYKWVECDKCSGFGDCPQCGGTVGIFLMECDVCGDDGHCPYCDGEGEVQMVKTETGWAYVSG